MSAKETALKLDAEDRPLEAVAAYERAVMESEADLEVYLNLAVLYFNCTDFGYFSYHRLPDDFMEHAWTRANALLTEAELRFGWHAEIEFWRKYFAFAFLGEKPFYEECEQLARSSRSPVAYFHLFASPGGEKYLQNAVELFEAVKCGATAKQRYVKGILESKFRRQKAAGPKSKE